MLLRAGALWEIRSNLSELETGVRAWVDCCPRAGRTVCTFLRYFCRNLLARTLCEGHAASRMQLHAIGGLLPSGSAPNKHHHFPLSKNTEIGTRSVSNKHHHFPLSKNTEIGTRSVSRLKRGSLLQQQVDGSHRLITPCTMAAVMAALPGLVCRHRPRASQRPSAAL